MKKQLKGITEKTAIHCPTEQEAIAVCKLFHEAGLTWQTGSSYHPETIYWDVYKEQTCYIPIPGRYGQLDYQIADNCTILSASDFLALNSSGEVEPEPKPQWVFKTDEELWEFIKPWNMGQQSWDDFLASKRKPPFELKCQDGVIIRDPEQWIWIINDHYGVGTCSIETAKEKYGDNFWSTEEAATAHLRQNSRQFSLGDMIFYTGIGYTLTEYKANELLNERLNGN